MVYCKLPSDPVTFHPSPAFHENVACLSPSVWLGRVQFRLTVSPLVLETTGECTMADLGGSEAIYLCRFHNLCITLYIVTIKLSDISNKITN